MSKLFSRRKLMGAGGVAALAPIVALSDRAQAMYSRDIKSDGLRPSSIDAKFGGCGALESDAEAEADPSSARRLDHARGGPAPLGTTAGPPWEMR